MAEIENVRPDQDPAENRRSLPRRIRPEEMVAMVAVDPVREEIDPKKPELPFGASSLGEGA